MKNNDIDYLIHFYILGYSGKRFIYERAKELGVKVIIIDGPDRYNTINVFIRPLIEFS